MRKKVDSEQQDRDQTKGICHIRERLEMAGRMLGELVTGCVI